MPFLLADLPRDVVGGHLANHLHTNELFTLAAVSALFRAETLRPALFQHISFSDTFNGLALPHLAETICTDHPILANAVQTVDLSNVRPLTPHAITLVLQSFPNMHSLILRPDLSTSHTPGSIYIAALLTFSTTLLQKGFVHQTLTRLHIYHPALDHTVSPQIVPTLLTTLHAITVAADALALDIVPCSTCSRNHTDAFLSCSYCPNPALACRPCRGEQNPDHTIPRRRDPPTQLEPGRVCSYCFRATCSACRSIHHISRMCESGCPETYDACEQCEPARCGYCGVYSARCTRCRVGFTAPQMRRCGGCEKWFCVEMGRWGTNCRKSESHREHPWWACEGWWDCEGCGEKYCRICWDIVECLGCQGTCVQRNGDVS